MTHQFNNGGSTTGGAPVLSSGALTEIDGRTVRLTSLDRVVYPSGFTKAEVIDYYHRIADVLLPHLAQRVVTRHRWPTGTQEDGFYEKNVPGGAPDWVQTHQVIGADGEVNYVIVPDTATLVWLANLSALELHVPQWRIDDQPEPASPILIDDANDPLSTTVVIDLDPGTGVEQSTIAEAALIVAAALADDGLIAHPKTSGSKGLQLYAPVEPTAASNCEGYVHALAKRLTDEHPQRFLMTMNVAARAGRIYLDFMQNRAARTTIAPYSLRGRATPSVSTPITWDEVADAIDGRPLQFTASEVLDRVEHQGDLFAAVLDSAHAAALPECS